MKGPLIGVLVLVTACTSAVQPSTTTGPGLTTSPSVESTTTVAVAPATPTFEVRGCSSAQPRPWSVLCRAHDLIVERSLYQPDAPSLAAAAAAGVRQVQADQAPVDIEDAVTCYVPDSAFQELCGTIVDRHRFEGIPIAELVEGAVFGLFRYGLDPYSSYLDPDTAQSFETIGPGHVLTLGLVVGARDGAGSVCGPLSDTCRLTVLTVFDFGPAADAGIVAGDTVVAIDGEGVEGISETEAAARMFGDSGSRTVLELETASGSVERELVHVDLPAASVEYGPATPDILYLRMNDMSQQAAQAVGQILQSPDADGITGLVLDLRGNPGGLVLSAQAVASQFLDEGVVVIEETLAGSQRLGVIEGGLVPASVGVVVITDAGTASAAEMVAAALQAAGRATVIGAPTFGKNVIQEVFEAPGGGEFRITVARWTGPDGTEVAPGGLQPDLLFDTAGDAPIVEAVRILGG